MLKLEKISKKLGGFEIDDVSFEVGEGEYFVLLGSSGTGKTILLETIAGLYRPDSGKIFLDGADITGEKIQKRKTAMVFQDQALFPHLAVGGNIAFGMKCMGVPGALREKRIRELAGHLEIETLLDRKPSTLSGGEAQRVALARAVAVEPRILLLDEPLSSLDPAARIDIRRLLRRLNRNGLTIIHVTHDYEEAASLASRIGIIENGGVAQVDTPGEIFHHPRSEFVAKFVGIRNFFPGRLTAREDNGCRRFVSGGLSFLVLTEAGEGEGAVMIRSEDVTVSLDPPSTSVLNLFKGTVTEIFPARPGVEVIIDIGFELAVLVSEESARRLSLKPGSSVYAGVKASAIRFMET